MVEAIIVVFILTVVFFCLIDFGHLFTARIVLDHAAARAARARAVGFNRYMVLKTARVAAIPVSGKCLTPFEDDEPFGVDAELARMPAYLAAESEPYARAILDYELWPQLGIDVGSDDVQVLASVSHSLPRRNDFERIYDGGLQIENEGSHGTVDLNSRFAIENHASLYLNDEGK